MTVRIVPKPPPKAPQSASLWVLYKKGHSIECKVHFLDHGLALLLDSELHRSQLYTFNSNTDLYREAADAKVAWQARGWSAR